MPRKKKSEFEGWPKRLFGTLATGAVMFAIVIVAFRLMGADWGFGAVLAGAISLIAATIYLAGGPKTISGLFAGLSGL